MPTLHATAQEKEIVSNPISADSRVLATIFYCLLKHRFEV